MSRFIHHFLLLLCALFVSLGPVGCVKNEFKVAFEVGNDVNRTYTLLYYASDKAKGWIVENVVNLQKGQGETLMRTVNPTLVYLFESGQRTPRAVFYAGRGDGIRITGKSSDPTEWNITGNKLTDALSEWRLANLKTIREATAPGGADALNKAVGRFVEENPDNPVSTILMLCYFDRRADEALFARLWKRLKGDAAEAKWKELSSRTDIMADAVPVDKLPARVVLNTVSTGCDTIVTGRVPALLYFTKNNVSTHMDDIDTLRALTRQFADSSLRVIADISFEPDSSTRWYSARTDTLRGAVRGWMPLGVSDGQAKALGVARVPYLIVVDRGGKIIYRGDKMQEAAAKFRTLMRHR